MTDQASEQLFFLRVVRFVVSGVKTLRVYILSQKSCSSPKGASVVADALLSVLTEHM